MFLFSVESWQTRKIKMSTRVRFIICFLFAPAHILLMLIMIFNMLGGYFLTFIMTLKISFVMALIISCFFYQNMFFIYGKYCFHLLVFFCLFRSRHIKSDISTKHVLHIKGRLNLLHGVFMIQSHHNSIFL